ncbi:acyl-CoA synthetase [Gautieria morchelliformis]|nr:acyl-CoA synthetase [Gautieria morchelliformis]
MFAWRLTASVHSLRRTALGHGVARRTLLTMSSVEGSLDPPLSTSTLSEYFRSEILAKHHSRPALICPRELPTPHGGPLSQNHNDSKYLAWDFAEFDRHIEALSRGLVSLGIKRGDRVGVVMGNTSVYALLQWACARVGAILVTLNPAYRAPELVQALKLVGVSALFIVPSLRGSDYLSMLSSALPSLSTSASSTIVSDVLPDLRSLVLVDNIGTGDRFEAALTRMKCTIDYRELFMWQQSAAEDKYINELSQISTKDDVINLQFTSGTTGAPKAVSLTHQLLNNALSIGRCMKFTPEDKLCNVPPLYHCFGLVLGNLAAWVHGSCIVYPSENYHPKATVDTLVAEQCTALHGVPTHFLGILEEVSRRGGVNFPKLRTGIAAGSPIPEELMRQLIDKLNLKELTIAYGMTPTSPVSFQTIPTDPIRKRVETVGRVQPHVKAKVIDPQGNILPVNQPGELCVAGYLVQRGYWNDPEQTASVMRRHPGDSDLWMHTGDETIMDEEGYLRVISRIKDIIIRGGENLFPVQIENTITNHRSIREAAVVAVPDATYGETVGVWIVRHANEPLITRSELRQWVGRQMNPQNQPVWVWFVGEDGVETELPKTASGKVQKHILRAWAARWAKLSIGKV